MDLQEIFEITASHAIHDGPEMIILISSLVAIGYSFRVALRHLFRNIRSKFIGDLDWYEITNESRNQNDQKGAAGFGHIKSLFKLLERTSWPYLNRGVCSVIWSKGSDGLLHLYIGVSHNAASNNALKSVAASMNGRANFMDSPPVISDRALVVAHRRQYAPDHLKQEMTHGQVADAISSCFDSSEHTGAFIVTLDLMRKSEGKRLVGNIIEESIMRGGEAEKFIGVQAEARSMTTDTVRASFAATSSSGMHKHSIDILTQGISKIGTFGYDVSICKPSETHARNSLVVGMPALIFAAVFGFTNIVSTFSVLIPVVLLSVVLLFNYLSTDMVVDSWFRRQIRMGEIVVPSFVWWNPRWKSHGIIRSLRGNASGNERVDNRIAPPSCKQVLSLHARSGSELLSFPDRMSVDVAIENVPMRGVPANMLDAINGIYLGRSGTHQHIQTNVDDLIFGHHVAGVSGAGKSNHMLNILAGLSWLSAQQSSLQITTIWGETKGEGAYEAWNIARRVRSSIFVDAHNPKSRYRLALEGRRISDGATPQEVARNCGELVGALQYAYGDAIQSASRELLEQSLRIAMLLNSDEIKFMGLDGEVDPHRPNIMALAFYILGGGSSIVDVGAKLIEFIDHLDNTDIREKYLYDALMQISRFIDPKERRQYNSMKSAPLNKLSELRFASMLWAPDGRQEIYIPDIINRFAPVVINMGPYWDEAINGYTSALDTSVNRRHLRIWSYLQWVYVKNSCSGWNKAGKRVLPLYDEAKDIASGADGSETFSVLEDAGKEGRSRGFGMTIGTQDPDQLPPSTQRQLLSMRSKVWYKMEEPNSIGLAVNDLNSGSPTQGAYTHENVRFLPDWTSYATLKWRNTITPPFTLMAPEAHLWAEVLFSNSSIQDAIAEYWEVMDRREEKRIS